MVCENTIVFVVRDVVNRSGLTDSHQSRHMFAHGVPTKGMLRDRQPLDRK